MTQRSWSLAMQKSCWAAIADSPHQHWSELLDEILALPSWKPPTLSLWSTGFVLYEILLYPSSMGHFYSVHWKASSLFTLDVMIDKEFQGLN